MRHPRFAIFCFPFFSLLISLLGLHGICSAADPTTITSTAAYAYVAVRVWPADYSEGIITGFACAGMARPKS